MNTLKKRLTANAASNLFVQGVATMIQLVSVPLFLFFWSKERYGEWILLSSIPSYLSLGEAGFATMAANKVSMFVAEGNLDKARCSLHTAWTFLCAISIIIMSLAAVASFLMPWAHWLKLTELNPSAIRWVVLLLSAYVVIGLISSIFGALYRAAYRNPRIGYITNTGKLVELGVTAASVAISQSLVVLAGMLLATRFLTALVTYIDSRRILPNLHLGLTGFSLVELKQTWRPSLLFTAFSLGNAVYFQGLTLLVGTNLGAGAVVIFNTTRALTRAIVQFVTMIKLSVWPEFSYLCGSGEIHKARRLNGLAVELSWLASAVMAIILYIMGPWIMSAWTHHVVKIDRWLLTLFLTSAVLNSIWFVTSGLLKGVNQHEGLAVRYLLATSMALLLGSLLMRPFGIYGAAMAMIACEAVLLPYAISRTCKALQQSPSELVHESIRLKVTSEIVSGYLKRRLAQSTG
jgi:O-antigen/teichoic acid export membrane protein